MAKPILVIRFPYREEMWDHFEDISGDLQKKLSDYHVLCMVESTAKSVVFECYNVPDIETKFEDLKKQVLDLINKTYDNQHR